MGKPTEAELGQALAEAARLRESGEDEHFLGKALLNHNYRLGLLEEVLSKAKLYLHSGHGSREHAVLLRVIDKAEKAAREAGDESGFAG